MTARHRSNRSGQNEGQAAPAQYRQRAGERGHRLAAVTAAVVAENDVTWPGRQTRAMIENEPS